MAGSHFLVLGQDVPGSASARAAALAAHKARLDAPPPGIRVHVSGPLHGAGGEPTGSLFILEAPDLPTARSFAEADPYLPGGVWQSVEVRPFDWRRGRP
ncbi:MAG: YciI family protein [Pseudomonadota bacterium]